MVTQTGYGLRRPSRLRQGGLRGLRQADHAAQHEADRGLAVRCLRVVLADLVEGLVEHRLVRVVLGDVGRRDVDLDVEHPGLLVVEPALNGVDTAKFPVGVLERRAELLLSLGLAALRGRIGHGHADTVSFWMDRSEYARSARRPCTRMSTRLVSRSLGYIS